MHTRTLYQPKKRQISLTALIDVVFILLLFFMLTSSFQHWRNVDLQIGQASGSSVTQQKPIILLLTTKAGLVIENTHQHLDNYQALKQSMLAQLAQSEPNAAPTPITLLPHEENSIQQIIDVLQHIKSLGFAVSLGDAYGDALEIE